jgi:8-oxo-dGTP pyrophosphatase MutT (NUDIX family)
VNKNTAKFLSDAAQRLVSNNGAPAAANGNAAKRLVSSNGAPAAVNGAHAPQLDASPPVVVPGTVRHVLARRVAFRGPHAGDEKRFLLEERTTKFVDGTLSRDYVWVRGQYALVVPISDGGVVFIRQYKKAAGRTLLVLPWGGIEHGESPLDAGRRELEEETGYSFRTAEVYGPFHDLPDKSTGGHWVVVARDAFRKGHPTPDEGELIHGVEFIPMAQLWQVPIPVLMHAGALRLAGL